MRGCPQFRLISGMAERFYLIVLLACSVLADGTNENEHSVKLEMDVENPEV